MRGFAVAGDLNPQRPFVRYEKFPVARFAYGHGSHAFQKPLLHQGPRPATVHFLARRRSEDEVALQPRPGPDDLRHSHYHGG